MWGALTVSVTLGLPPLTPCVLSPSTLLRLQVALQRKCLKRALGCVHFPGLSRSGSGSRALPKGADLVGPGFCALPRSGAWEARSPEVAGASYHLRRPSRWSGWQRAPVSLLGSWSLAATLPKDVNRPESQEVLVSNQKPAHSLVGNAFSGADLPLSCSGFCLLLPSLCLGMGRSVAG